MGKVIKFPIKPDNKIRAYAVEYLKKKKEIGEQRANLWAHEHVPAQLRIQLLIILEKVN